MIGLAIFMVVFAINSAVHSYLILAYSDDDEVATNVGFYYMANAGGRLLGTLLSGVVFEFYGFIGCLSLPACWCSRPAFCLSTSRVVKRFRSPSSWQRRNHDSITSVCVALVRARRNFVKRQSALQFALVFLLLVFWMWAAATAAAQTEGLVLKGDGSTFAYPMYSKWIEEYEKTNPGVHLTYVSNGSGAGIHDIMMGIVDFAGTDGPLNKTQMLDFSTHRNCEVLHFPTAIGADVPIYNLPGITATLNFTPQALVGIFLGTITKWNDQQIAQPNPGTALPDEPIVVVHRQDGSGTTYVWTDYLSKVSSDWSQRVGRGISVIWPTGIAAQGNAGVSKTVASTPYSIGYSELTYAVHNQLTYGTVLNRSGRFIKADLRER